MGDRAVIETHSDYVVKRFNDSTSARLEASFYRLVPWAAPRLLAADKSSLTIERLTVADVVPDWRPVAQLVALIERLHSVGIHHRDVHIRNVVRGPGGAPLLIDWESAIVQKTEFSYDLYGPEVSGVDIPEIHRRFHCQWWDSPQKASLGKRWGAWNISRVG